MRWALTETKLAPERATDKSRTAPHSEALAPLKSAAPGRRDAAPVEPTGPVVNYPFGLMRADLRRFFLLFAAAAVACLFLWKVQAILPPFIIAFALAALLEPTIRYLQNVGHSRGRAIAVIYLSGLCIVGLFGIFVLPLAAAQTTDLISNFGTYATTLQNAANAFMHAHAHMLRAVGIHQRNVSDLVQQKSGLLAAVAATGLVAVQGILEGIASKFFWIVIIPIATFFFMRDYPLLRARIISVFPDQYHLQIDTMSREVVDVFTAYLRGLAKICSMYAVTAFVLFSLLGVRYSLFLGLLAGAFYAVPYLGQLVTSVSVATVCYLMDRHTALFVFHVAPHSAGYSIAVAVCAILAQNFFDQLIYPRVVGGSVGLHPVVAIFALGAGATLFGLVGMLLAVPVAASVQLILTYFFPRLTRQPPADLLRSSGAELPPEPDDAEAVAEVEHAPA
ncbi:MAG: AI-2E family transporter [Armatimonadetes bacterium]|nr:AI-2E family transporter [Armatimonadota bacterium]MDE2207845.1 AI-2E family transporter [Armatimonadota bacterium]